jgi:anthranilate/para-aminobenzoate synthase component I
MSVKDFNEYQSGIRAAEEDIRNGDIYDLDAAIYSFELDPPDSPFQRGYLRQLVKTGSL